MSLQNPEGQFRRFAPDYSGIRVQEPIFAVMADPYGKTQGYQMDILDQYGGEKLGKLRERVESAYGDYQSANDALSSASLSEAEQKRTMDLLKYELDEISGANLTLGEDETLEQQYRRMKNSRLLMEDLAKVQGISGYEQSESAGSLIGRAASLMEHASGLDETLSGLSSQMADIEALIGDFNRELSDYIDDLRFDEQTYHEVEERLDVINGLKVKYGNSIEGILDYEKEQEKKYEQLLHHAAYVDTLQKEKEKAEQHYLMLAAELHEERVHFAENLKKEITEALTDLNFLNVAFDIEVNRLDSYISTGMDEILFMISTNVGEKLRPLSSVASGGELSRIMLAVKAVLADRDETDTLIFDEIDVGISGRTAQKVSEQLCRIAKHHQVISITHLPQIAAMADAHYLIEKNVVGEQTVTEINRLDHEAEIAEIARLLGGVEITETVLESAREMKAMAAQVKQKL